MHNAYATYANEDTYAEQNQSWIAAMHTKPFSWNTSASIYSKTTGKLASVQSIKVSLSYSNTGNTIGN